jgi:beta-glucanase (GH16 family)
MTTIEGQEPNWSAGPSNLAESWDFHEGGGGFGNDELQIYTRDQVRLDATNNAFVITAIARNGSYRSAKLTSKTTFGLEEGYVEARLSAPSAKGLWPAFWAMPGVEMGLIWPDGVRASFPNRIFIPIR